MTLTTQTIGPGAGARRKSKRVGRGNASQKGTYSSRGLKGQRSRSGGKSGLARLGFKSRLQKVPKLRGFKSDKIKPETVTLSRLSQVCTDGGTITPALLKKLGAVHRPERGVKIVATGAIDKALNISGCLASKKAAEHIEKAGGTITF